ncbi:MAG: uroporphyrinogen-III C-methyltransferase [Blastocatellia bacterium]|jgi:uroporphyrin-III C-methyltransferase|nr:uroporphyrinogen-III C-methyltransferase [Blastocatellia bacterium]
MRHEKGHVWLIGAGPGDPGLLTLAAARALERADVVVHDDLVSTEVLALARPGVEYVPVGKRAGMPSTRQSDITELLVGRALAGERVARLKGGDPFVFGRGAEEAAALTAAGIRWEVIPGVSSGIAGPAYAGIPLTHRDLSSSVLFVTAHEANGRRRAPIDWSAVAIAAETIVVFMGARRLREVARALIAGGRDAETPVAVIRWATTPDQETYTGTLDDFAAGSAEDRAALRIDPPAIAVVGDVVRLRQEMQWFTDVEWTFGPLRTTGAFASGATTRPSEPVRPDLR